MSDIFDFRVVELRTPRLRLRALAVEDAGAIFAYATNPEMARFTLWPAHPNLDFTIGFVRHFIAGEFLAWAIAEPENRDAIGMVFLHSFHRHHRKAEIAFNLARPHWGKGMVTEAAGAVLPVAFGPVGLHRIEATCMPENHGSRRVLEKLGMKKEGRLRQSHARYDGYHDMDLYAVLKEDAVGGK
ncbi:MAG: family acetyltransferase [Verrucomicrobia bacterium]|nr:family acetyltransferase [Verrucomicrobiota bacterium]